MRVRVFVRVGVTPAIEVDVDDPSTGYGGWVAVLFPIIGKALWVAVRSDDVGVFVDVNSKVAVDVLNVSDGSGDGVKVSSTPTGGIDVIDTISVSSGVLRETRVTDSIISLTEGCFDLRFPRPIAKITAISPIYEVIMIISILRFIRDQL